MARIGLIGAMLCAMLVGAAAQSFEQRDVRQGLERSQRNLDRRAQERSIGAQTTGRNIDRRIERLRLEQRTRPRPSLPTGPKGYGR